MNNFIRSVVTALAVTTFVVAPSAWADGHHGGAVRGPHGGGAVHYSGPHHSGTAVRGPYGGGAVHTTGPYHSGTAVRGPHGGGAVHGVGPYGSRTYVHGGGPGHYYGHYAHPGWSGARIHTYQRGFYGYPGWHPYGAHYGLIGPLVAFPNLGFLSAGLLIGSYLNDQRTVYVYVVQDEAGRQVEYRVDDLGNVIGMRTIP